MTDAGFLIARRRHSRRGRSRPQACVGGMRAAHCLSAVGPRRITWLFSIATLLGVCRCGGCHSGVRLISQRVWPCVDVCQRCDGVAHAPKRITRMHRCWCKAAGALCCSTACAHSSTTPANLLQTGACVRVRACVRACHLCLSLTRGSSPCPRQKTNQPPGGLHSAVAVCAAPLSRATAILTTQRDGSVLFHVR